MDDFEKDFYNQITEAIYESLDEISKGLEEKVEENTQATKELTSFVKKILAEVETNESGFKDR